MLVDPTMIEMLKELQMPGMPDPVQEILEIFEADATVVAERLRVAAVEGDLEEIKASAHRLKGASGSLGAIQLCAVLGEVEVAAKGGQLDLLRPLVEGIPELMAATLLEIHQLQGAQ